MDRFWCDLRRHVEEGKVVQVSMFRVRPVFNRQDSSKCTECYGRQRRDCIKRELNGPQGVDSIALI